MQRRWVDGQLQGAEVIGRSKMGLRVVAGSTAMGTVCFPGSDRCRKDGPAASSGWTCLPLIFQLVSGYSLSVGAFLV